MVDFAHIGDGGTRMKVGTVNANTGTLHYFDSRDHRLGIDHVMASGALPPAFPEVRIDGEPYWDGGLYSNAPIEAVLDDNPRRDSLIFAVNVLHQTGPQPKAIWDVMGREKDIQYASRADSHIVRQEQVHHLWLVIQALARQIPASARSH
jgi:NTE family protein